MAIYVLASVAGAGAADVTWYPLEGPAAQRVLVPGEPPLLVGQANVFNNCVEFGFGIAMTQAEQEQLRTALMQEYLEFRSDLLEDLKELGELWKDVCATPVEQQGKYRLILRDVLVGEADRSPGLGISQAIRKINAMEADVVGAGTPPVTRRSLDALLELVQMALRFRDRRVVAWDQAQRQELEAALLRRLPSLTPVGRNWLANADIHRALIERNWQETPADEREVIRRLLIETFAPASKAGSAFPVDVEGIPLPPPNLFPLPTVLPWPMR
ncbi:MAG TPA: hypothetical protein PLP29_10400 [Candidatus Ozemobacteraceae bacterium]|nr:hypothetical protein [Candidatus Ozemobacteraceae bacterium]